MKKHRKKLKMFDVMNTIFMLLLVVVILYPLYYTVIASLSHYSAVAKGEVVWKPIGFSLESYQLVFQNRSVWTGYMNTIFYTVLGTLFNLYLTIPTAYVLSKKNMPLRNQLMTFFLITMYFGGGMVPSYMLIKNLGLINTRWVLILTGGLSVYNMIVSRTYFSTSIPDSLYEAAEIDGAGEIKKFLSIAIPLAKPIIAVMVLYYAVGHWNSYFNALLYVSNRDYEPLQAVLRRILILNETALDSLIASGNATEEELMDATKKMEIAYTMKYAVVFIASAPMLIIYPFIQKYFAKGVMIGAVKE